MNRPYGLIRSTVRPGPGSQSWTLASPSKAWVSPNTIHLALLYRPKPLDNRRCVGRKTMPGEQSIIAPKIVRI